MISKRPDIYTQHDKAFAAVSAYVVLNSANERVATIALKFPRDGAGRLYAYVHWIGLEMVRGHANGYGYDKRSAACSVAARKLRDAVTAMHDHKPVELVEPLRNFVSALEKDNGEDWTRRLEAAGFKVFQAV